MSIRFPGIRVSRCVNWTACFTLVFGSCDSSPPVPPTIPPRPARDAAPAVVRTDSNTWHRGVVVADQLADLAPRLRLPITSVHVTLGDTVQAGQPLAQLDTTGLSEELAIAESVLDSARARMQVAEHRMQLAHAFYYRLRNLADGRESTASRTEIDQAELQLRVAEGEHSTARENVEQQGARVRQLQADIASCRLIAPFDGCVAMRYRCAGELAGPDAPVLRLVSSERHVRFALPPPSAASVPADATVVIKDETTNEAVTARITRISPEIDTASGLVFAEAVFDNAPSVGFRIGQPVWVVLMEGTTDRP